MIEYHVYHTGVGYFNGDPIFTFKSSKNTDRGFIFTPEGMCPCLLDYEEPEYVIDESNIKFREKVIFHTCCKETAQRLREHDFRVIEDKK